MAATITKQPKSGILASGTTSWVLIVTSPNWTTHNLYASVANGDIAVSFDNSAIHLASRSTSGEVFAGLDIPPNTAIYAKTFPNDTQFVRGFVSVW